MLDVRRHDELELHRFSLEKLNNRSKELNENKEYDILNIPAENIKYNVDILNKIFNNYDQIIVTCKLGKRASFVKNTYFADNQKVIINPNGHFGIEGFDSELLITVKGDSNISGGNKKFKFDWSLLKYIV